MVQEMEDYGVYDHVVDVDFDVEQLSDSDDSADENQNENQSNPYKNTTNRQRQDIYEALLERSHRGKLKKTSTREVAQLFPVSQRTVQRIWDIRCHLEGRPVDVSSKKSKNSRKKFEVDLSRVATIALHKRSTIRKLAKALEVSKSSMHRWFKQGLLRRYSNSLKPYLKEANMKERLQVHDLLKLSLRDNFIVIIIMNSKCIEHLGTGVNAKNVL
ncbi:hypothetical protein QOZ80_6BG0487580 [Eleusine coracana subsp. coracana]|nr:hypothetical protein QOZ80_6BG0487580 [Eleusine coracana subsp. coracana]